MNSKVVIREDGLATIGIPLQSQTIRLKDVQSVEVYSKSIVPPLVSAIFISVSQMLILALRGVAPIPATPDFVNFTLLIFNVPVLLCILLAFFRARFVTLRISLQSGDRPLAMRFVPRSVAENFVDKYSTIHEI